MKTIGLIGGMSWESSLEYYRLINEYVKQRLGGFHSAKIVMLSVDFAEVEELQHEGRWDAAGKMMAESAKALQNSGADLIVLCTNTMHKCANEIEAAIQVPFLHIADPTAEKIKSAGIRSIGLLGTRFTMEQDFYRGRLAEKFGLNVLIPNEADREIIHRVIYDELVMGKIDQASRVEYQRIINELVLSGAEGVILGCTEIGQLISPRDVSVPVFDTTILHAQAAVDLALK